MPLSAQDNARYEFWPEVDAYLKLSQKSRLFFMYSATKLDDRQTFADGSVGIHYDWYGGRTILPRIRFREAAKHQTVLFRVGYEVTRAPSDSGKTVGERTPMFEAHARTPLPWKLLITDRNRFDLRFVGGTFTPRYRNRLKIERTFKIGRFELTPYTQAEVFYDWRWNTFNRQRYTGGAEWAITRFLVLEGYSAMQRDTKSSPEYVYAGGVALQFYFNRGH